jgi:hypothetical protein
MNHAVSRKIVGGATMTVAADPATTAQSEASSGIVLANTDMM